MVALTLILFQGQPTASQLTVPLHTLRRSSVICSATNEEDTEGVRNEFSTSVRSHLATTMSIYQCGGSFGWTRIAYLNMSDSAQNCPSPWAEFTSGGKRVCFRSSSSGASCDSVMYSNSQQEYSQVCGHIIGYQYGGLHAFSHYHKKRYSVDSYYIDGISVTHGPSPWQHIWTFAVGFSERDIVAACPCGSPTNKAAIPPYIGNNYFCETGYNRNSTTNSAMYSDDPLWDSEGCSTHRSCECTLHSPPWFTVKLNSSTADDIEVRSCSNEPPAWSNVGIELIELYVK